MLESRDGRRVVVTGAGVVSACGVGKDDFWPGLSKTPVTGTVRRAEDFDPARTGLGRTELRRLDRFAQLAVLAAGEAVEEAGLDPERHADAGVVIGSGIGGVASWEEQVRNLDARGPRAVSPLTVPLVMPNAAAGAVSQRWGFHGPCEAISTACATGTHSIAAAARLIAAGRLDTALAGGTESALGINVPGFTNMRAMSATGHSRPFDVDRDGFCLSEGAGVLVLEELRQARARGARIYAEIAGTGSSADAYHLTAPPPGGPGAIAAMTEAIRDGGLEPSDIVHINAHGTSTPLNDAAEAQAIATVFGAHRPVVTSVKGATGHPLGAAGGIEAVAMALAYEHREIPPTVGTATVDPAFGLDLALAPRSWQPGPALSHSFAFGGHNAVLLFTPVR